MTPSCELLGGLRGLPGFHPSLASSAFSPFLVWVRAPALCHLGEPMAAFHQVSPATQGSASVWGCWREGRVMLGGGSE